MCRTIGYIGSMLIALVEISGGSVTRAKFLKILLVDEIGFQFVTSRS